MFKRLKALWGDRRGNILAIAGAALPLLVGAAGLATDTIEWTLWKRELQRAADSAAIAGVYTLSNGGVQADAQTSVEHDLTLNQHTGMTLASGYPDIVFLGDDGQMRERVQVTVAVRKALPFSSMFMLEAPTIIATATAASVPGPGDPCVNALENSAKNSGIMITGNAELNMPDCTLHTNSPATNSAYAKGSAEVYADGVSAVGGIQESDQWHISSYDPYSPAIEDPFKDVNPDPSDMKCGGQWKTQGSKTVWENAVLNENTDFNTVKDGNGNKANCFSSLSVSSGTTLDLDDPSKLGPGPKTIYISGGDAFVQGNLKCTDCTIVLTNKDQSTSATIGNFKVNADSKVNITAPTAVGEKYRGIAIFQDRRAQDKAPGNKINGNSESIIQGALYFPSQELDYNGTGNTTAVCTMFVSRRIKFSGNSATSNKFKSLADCSQFGFPNSGGGTRRVRLVA
jgi:hypothetical protein